MKEIKFKFVIDNQLLTEPYTLDEILEKSKEDITINLDNQYSNCHCLNEGCNHCECQSQFEDSEITGKVQFTGLKDKNGKDIYEGDVVKFNRQQGYTYLHKGSIEKVSWFNFQYSGFGFNENIPLTLKRSKEIEVIGNIYENPELIK